MIIETFSFINTKSHSIKIDEKWYFPDILIDNYLVIEFFGNYWHANPKFYKETDIIHHNLTARDIWNSDKNRISVLENNGYKVVIIWEDKWKNYKQRVKDIITDEIYAIYD